MLNWKRAFLIALMQSAWLCAATAADQGAEGRTDADPRRGAEEFRFEDYENLDILREMEEAVRAGLLREFPIGSDVELLIHLIERREPRRGRYCIERTKDMVWCQYWHSWSGDPRISLMYWVRIYHSGEPKKIKDIGVMIVAG
jgi:hypothetical protein